MCIVSSCFIVGLVEFKKKLLTKGGGIIIFGQPVIDCFLWLSLMFVVIYELEHIII
uniref:Uncharacterized protein n=1 Tax=Arundo donax TaxID=35708 RepID=A0A0A9CI75_ARUDO